MAWTPSSDLKTTPLVQHIDETANGGRVFEFQVSEARASVWLKAQLDEQEHQTRLERGQGPVTSAFQIEALYALSTSTLSCVSPRLERPTRELIRIGAAWGSEDVDGSLWATACFKPPCSVISIEVSATRPRNALKAAQLWTGYGQRNIRLEEEQKVTGMVLAEASIYGVGVKRPDKGEVLLAPTPFTPERCSPARWTLSERLYEAALQSSFNSEI